MVQRKKKVIVTGVSREEADEAFGVYATADAEISKINASMELQFAKIREKNAERLTLLQAERESAFEVLQAYAVENKDSLFAKKKSLELTHGVIGFRTGTPKLKTLKGFTWASALELVRRFLGFAYVRTVDELAKDRLLADRELEGVVVYDKGPTGRAASMKEALEICGLHVVQDEAFYVEPKKEE